MAFDLTLNYDENLMENAFFQTLRNDYGDLFVKAVSENCVICVPKRDCFRSYALTLNDFLAHVLVPTDELPESHFVSLQGTKIKISNRTVTVEKDGGGDLCRVPVLFQETFYTQDGLKYEVLCVQQPLDATVACSGDTRVLRNYRDCLDFLWTECGSHETIEKIDGEIVRHFDMRFGNHERKKCDQTDDASSLRSLKESVNLLYLKCMKILFKNSNIKKKYKDESHHLLNNLTVALYTYVQQGIYKRVMEAVTVCTAADDARLNKRIRNLSDLHFKDFKIKSKLYSKVPKARLELSRLNGYTTVLGKLGCLQRALRELSDCETRQKDLLNADDLIQVLSFLLIKGNLPNWHAQLTFLKLLNLSKCEFDESSYLITSLEAAIAYIQNGLITNSECDSMGSVNHEYGIMQLSEAVRSGSESSQGKDIDVFFKEVASGNLESVKLFLENCPPGKTNKDPPDLCHPLCLCDKCSALLKTRCNSGLSVNSTDDQGLTALHVASMYNCPNVVEYLLARGSNANAADCEGRSPAHYAALRGHQNALLLLLHHDASVNAVDNALNTPLHLSSNNGHDNCVKALTYFSEYLGVKPNVNQQNARGDTALHNAAKWGYESIVRHLLESGADPTVRNRKKYTALDYAHNPKILDLLKQKCHCVDRYITIKPESPVYDLDDRSTSQQQHHQSNRTCKGVTPDATDKMKEVEKILRAVEKGDVNLVSFYMGLDVAETRGCASENDDETADTKPGKCHPLCRCEECDRASAQGQIDARVSRGDSRSVVSVNVCDSGGVTALHVAAREGKLDLVRVLVRHGALLNVQTSETLLTPLMMAAQHQRLETVRDLLRSGCQIDLQDSRLNTALHHACVTGNRKVVEVLLRHEADTNLRNLENKTALQEAKDRLYLGVVEAFKHRTSGTNSLTFD